MNKKLHIIKFKSRKGNQYIYDIRTNAIFYTPEVFIEILNNYYLVEKRELISKLQKRYPQENVEHIYNSVDHLINKYDAFFTPVMINPVENHFFKDKKEFENKISNINQLILEVTENCNLNCKYCLFSGNYDSFRNHSKKRMTFKIAQKSIDYFFDLLTSAKRTRKIGIAHINFYGGEPLLNFSLIKKCVEYVNNFKKNKIKDEIQYGLTTNGTLLRDEIIDFLIKNRFSLAISLDGPREEHDKNRVFKNGKGSFNIVFNNIKKIKRIINKEKDYAKYITFVITYSLNHNLIKIYDFFTNNFPLKKFQLRVSPIRDNNLLEEVPKKFLDSYVELCKLYYDKISKNGSDMPIFLSNFFNSFYKSQDSRLFYDHRKRSFFSAACSPDLFRLFTSIDGKYHMCERINHHFPVGNCESGISYEKVKEIFHSYNKKVISNCYYCPAVHTCNTCFSFAGKNGYFQSREFCKSERDKIKNHLIGYVSILEENPYASF